MSCSQGAEHASYSRESASCTSADSNLMRLSPRVCRSFPVRIFKDRVLLPKCRVQMHKAPIVLGCKILKGRSNPKAPKGNMQRRRRRRIVHAQCSSMVSELALRSTQSFASAHAARRGGSMAQRYAHARLLTIGLTVLVHHRQSFVMCVPEL